MDTVVADKTHRGHAIIDQVHADLKSGPLAHLPSGVFTANSAWRVLAVIAFNLTRAAGVIADQGGRLAKATNATIRRTLIAVPARLARSARRITMHLPAARPWENAFTRLFAITHATASRGNPLTSAATAARSRTAGWTTGMRRPAIPHAPATSAATDPRDPTHTSLIGESRLRAGCPRRSARRRDAHRAEAREDLSDDRHTRRMDLIDESRQGRDEVVAIEPQSAAGTAPRRSRRPSPPCPR